MIFFSSDGLSALNNYRELGEVCFLFINPERRKGDSKRAFQTTSKTGDQTNKSMQRGLGQLYNFSYYCLLSENVDQLKN